MPTALKAAVRSASLERSGGDVSAMTKLEIFGHEAAVGAHVTLRLTRGDDVSGRVEALDDHCIHLRTDRSTVTVFADLLAGWEVHHGDPAAVRPEPAAPTTSPAPPHNAGALPVAPTTPHPSPNAEAIEQFTRVKAKVLRSGAPRAD